jgi:Tol biopolymer transport system component
VATYVLSTAIFFVLSSIAAAYAEPVGDTESALLSQTRQLTFEGRRAGEGYFNADGTQMVFQSERDADNPFYQIYLMDLETGDVEQISPGHGKTTCAWIHPSNRKVLYASTHDDPAAREKMQAELDFRASGKERRYSWDYDESFDIYAQDRDTGERRNLTAVLGYDAEGAYSPDGSQIVFASNRHAYAEPVSTADAAIFEHDKSYMMELYLMDADGSNVRRLTQTPGYDGGPFFSADGKRVTWRRFSKDGATAEIYTMDLASGEERQLTRMGVMSWAPYFHPSGDYLIFASNREGFANFELFMVDAAGRGEPVRVTYTEGFDGLPVFSPDGKRLSWTSNRTASKQSQIFIADWDDAEARRLLGIGDQAADAGTTAAVDLTPTDGSIRAEDARLHVEHLSSEDMAGRFTGSAGERQATAYVAGVFEQLGLQPAGDRGGWFQTFRFSAGAALGADNRLTVEGLGEPFQPTLDSDWRPLALSRSGRTDAAPVVFAGYGIVAPDADEVPAYDSYGDLDVSGKWVMVLRFQPDSIPPAWRRHLLHYSDLAYKAAVAKRLGAIGLIVVSGPAAVVSQQLVELKADAASATTSLAGVSISDDLGARLLSAGGHDLAELQRRLDDGKTVEAFALPEVTLAASLEITRKRRTARNVVARLPAPQAAGRPPVIIGAHVDHLGHGEGSGSLAREDERGAVHHGADDNASGVAALLESAQYLSTLRAQGKLAAQRDILFAAWSGEELGTLGSSHFVELLADGGDLKGKVSAYLNMDMVGHLRTKLYLQGTGSSSAWSREIERRNVPVGLPIATKQDPYLPTDSTSFYMQGVPILSAFTGAHEDYSTPRDTADKLNYEGVRDVARLMSGIARSLALAESEPDYLAVERKQSGLARRHLRAYLGTIPAYGQDEAIKGVKLQGAVKGGPAEKAGIQNGDMLVGLAGVDIETIHDFMTALAGLKVGESTDLVVVRNGERLSLEVTPVARE